MRMTGSCIFWDYVKRICDGSGKNTALPFMQTPKNRKKPVAWNRHIIKLLNDMKAVRYALNNTAHRILKYAMNTSEKHQIFAHTGDFYIQQECAHDGRSGMDVKCLASAMQSRLTLWRVTLLVMLEDDAAMLAFIFC